VPLVSHRLVEAGTDQVEIVELGIGFAELGATGSYVSRTLVLPGRPSGTPYGI